MEATNGPGLRGILSRAEAGSQGLPKLNQVKLSHDTIRPILVLLIFLCSLSSIQLMWQNFPSFAASMDEFLDWSPLITHGLGLFLLSTVPVLSLIHI